MGPLIRDLIHFEEVEDVIKIRKEERAREYVEKYVISDSLRRNLLFMLEMLSGATHKSFNVVGNYGTGKSHFLAFVAALLEHPEYRALVRDEQVRGAAEGLKRRYLVVKLEWWSGPGGGRIPRRRSSSTCSPKTLPCPLWQPPTSRPIGVLINQSCGFWTNGWRGSERLCARQKQTPFKRSCQMLFMGFIGALDPRMR